MLSWRLVNMNFDEMTKDLVEYKKNLNERDNAKYGIV